MKKTIFFSILVLLLSACAQESDFAKSQISAVESNAIIGGQSVDPKVDYAGSIVGLYNVADSSICTGSIISETLVVTAAHCAPQRASELVVFFGNNIETATVTRRVSKIYLNPVWGTRLQEETDWGDVAVLRLQTKIPVGYKPIKILPTNLSLKKGMTVVLAGYGLSNGVTRQGSGRLRQTSVLLENPKHGNTEVVLNQRSGKGACHGDSGGPAYLKVGKEHYLFGVTSRGYKDEQDDCSQYAIYTNLQNFKASLDQLK